MKRDMNFAPPQDPDSSKFDMELHMQSKYWHDLRLLVMAKHQFCQGCLSGYSRDMRHAVEDHIGHEFAHEMVCLCQPCLDRFDGVTN